MSCGSGSHSSCHSCASCADRWRPDSCTMGQRDIGVRGVHRSCLVMRIWNSVRDWRGYTGWLGVVGCGLSTDIGVDWCGRNRCCILRVRVGLVVRRRGGVWCGNLRWVIGCVGNNTCWCVCPVGASRSSWNDCCLLRYISSCSLSGYLSCRCSLDSDGSRLCNCANRGWVSRCAISWNKLEIIVELRSRPSEPTMS